MLDGPGNEGCDGDDSIDDEADDTFVTGANIQDRFSLHIGYLWLLKSNWRSQ